MYNFFGQYIKKCANGLYNLHFQEQRSKVQKKKKKNAHIVCHLKSMWKKSPL